MRKLTVELMDCSDVSRVDGDELDFIDSGEHLRRGTAVCWRLESSLLDSLPGDEIGNEVHLLGHSKDSGTVCSDGSKDRQS
jgi:hypothetical protein